MIDSPPGRPYCPDGNDAQDRILLLYDAMLQHLQLARNEMLEGTEGDASGQRLAAQKARRHVGQARKILADLDRVMRTDRRETAGNLVVLYQFVGQQMMSLRNGHLQPLGQAVDTLQGLRTAWAQATRTAAWRGLPPQI